MRRGRKVTFLAIVYLMLALSALSVGEWLEACRDDMLKALGLGAIALIAIPDKAIDG